MLQKLAHPLLIALVGSTLSVVACVLALQGSHEARSASRLALSATEEIRSSRSNSILLSCEEQNERHVVARAGLEALAQRTRPKRSPSRAEAKEQARVLELFVEAVAPKYDCAARLRQLTRP